MYDAALLLLLSMYTHGLEQIQIGTAKNSQTFSDCLAIKPWRHPLACVRLVRQVLTSPWFLESQKDIQIAILSDLIALNDRILSNQPRPCTYIPETLPPPMLPKMHLSPLTNALLAIVSMSYMVLAQSQNGQACPHPSKRFYL